MQSGSHQSTIELFRREEALIRQNAEPVQRLMKSTAIRESFLRSAFTERPDGFAGAASYESVQKLRILTVHCVECIHEWRLYLESLAEEPLTGLRECCAVYVQKMS